MKCPKVFGILHFFCYLLISCADPSAPPNLGEFTHRDEGSTITITGLVNQNSTVITIPSFIHNKPVTAIARAAFRGTALSRVSIPDSVTTIGNEAFYLSASLSEVQIGNGIKSIGSLAFTGTSLNTLTILAPEAPRIIGFPLEGILPIPLREISLVYPLGSTGYDRAPWRYFGRHIPLLGSSVIEKITTGFQKLIISLKPLYGATLTVEAHTEADFTGDAVATAKSNPRATTTQEITLTGLSEGTFYHLRVRGYQNFPGTPSAWVPLLTPYKPHGIFIADATPRTGKIIAEVRASEEMEAKLQAFSDKDFSMMVKEVFFTINPDSPTVEIDGLSNEITYYLRALLSDGSAEYRYSTPLIPTANGKQYIHRLSELAKIGVDSENYPDNWNYELSMDLNFADANNDGIRDDPFDSDDDADNGNWTPLSPGTYDDDGNYLSGGYAGNFDGKNHSIEGLTITTASANRVGFFNFMLAGGQIKDLELLGGSFSGNSNVGSLIGYNEGEIIGSYATGSVTGQGDEVGGLAGSSSGSISDSYSTGDVTGQGDEVGGLAGSSSGSISDSHSTGDVRGSSSVGGLAGVSGGTITGSYATGSVTGQGDEVGGLAGSSSGSISDSHSTGDVRGNSSVGGLAGVSGGTITGSYATGSVTGQGDEVGGLAGSSSGSISDSYSTGDVRGNSSVGGLAGVSGGTITGSYATGSVTGQWDEVGGLAGSSSGSISDSYSTGDVSGQWNKVGGLVGYNSGVITESYSTGVVTSTQGGLVGGLAGSSSGSINDSYSTGVVTSTQGGLVGGLAGDNGGGSITGSYATGDVSGWGWYVGGLAGNNGGSITNSYATGNVSGQGNIVGGLVGNHNFGSITNSYATGNVSGQGADLGGLIGLINTGTITNSYRYANQSITDPDGNAKANPNTSGSTVSLDQLKTPSWYTDTGNLGWAADKWIIEGRVNGTPPYHPHITNFPNQPNTPLPTP